MSGATTTIFDVVVIGAGMSGLVVAHAAQHRGIRVAVVDAGSEPGGVIGTRERDGFRYETAANSVLDNTPSLQRLIDDLGIAGERIDASPNASRRYVVRDGRLVTLPTSPAALFTSRAFSTRAKLRLLREPFTAPAPGDREETVAEFTHRRLGAEWLDYAVDPFVGGIHAGDPAELSLRASFPRLYALEQQHGSLVGGQLRMARERRRSGETTTGAPRSFSFRDGMRTLPKALSQSIDRVFMDTRIESLRQRTDGGFDVRGQRGREPFELTTRIIVIATPAHAAAMLIRTLAPQAAHTLETIEYAPVAIVASAYRRDDVRHPLDGFGFLVPSKERWKILGTLFSSSMFEGRAPAGALMLTTFIGGRRNPSLVAEDDRTLADIVAGTHASLIGAGAPLWSEVVRWPRAIPQYTVGHLDRVAAIDEAIGAVPGLNLCGSWRGGISVGDRVNSGYAMADTLQRRLAAPARAI